MTVGYDGTVYALVNFASPDFGDEPPGHLVALDPEKGTEKFRIPLPASRFSASGTDHDSSGSGGGAYSRPIVLADGSINLAAWTQSLSSIESPNSMQAIPRNNSHDPQPQQGSTTIYCPSEVLECWAPLDTFTGLQQKNQIDLIQGQEITLVHIEPDGTFQQFSLSQNQIECVKYGTHYTYVLDDGLLLSGGHVSGVTHDSNGGTISDGHQYQQNLGLWSTGTCETQPPGPNGFDLMVIPNGAGGVLVASETNDDQNPVWIKNVTQPAASGAGTEIRISSLNTLNNLVIGENGNVFAAGSWNFFETPRLVSFNLASGAQNWSYDSPLGTPDDPGYVDLVAAGPNNSLYATEGEFFDQIPENAFTLDASGVRTDNPTGSQAVTFVTSAGIGSNIWFGQTVPQTASLGGFDLGFGPALFMQSVPPPQPGMAAYISSNPVAVSSTYQNPDPSGTESLGAIYRETVAELAKASVGNSSRWKEAFPNPSVTCNIFVRDILNDASDETAFHIPAPTRPPRTKFFVTRIDAFLAADWANPFSKAGCWKVLPGGPDAALAGDVLATGYPSNGPDGTGHVGIIVHPDAGTPNYRLASAADVAPYFWAAAQKQGFIPGTITLTDYGFRLPGFDPSNPANNQGLKQDSIVRRFSCH